ncbi:MAG: DUF3575 domain-containing protein [Alistipes sp.]|nr:DUF3575 domain-containing protein [Alistipes sp.]
MRLLGKYAGLLIAFALMVVGVRAYGSEPQPEVLVSHQQIEQESFNLDTKLHKISILYENNKAWPRWSYANNIRAHKALVDMVKTLSSSKSGIRSIVIEGSASPLGSESYNHNLALRRAKILRNIIAKMSGGDKIPIHTVSVGENWEVFLSYIETNYHATNRERVLEILRTSKTITEKERLLQALDNGKTWKILVNHYMTSARNAVVIRVLEITDLTPITTPISFAAPITAIDADLLARDSIKPRVVEMRKPVVAFRSNLLVPALNVGVEVPIGKKWSVAADYYFPWVWPKRDNKDCFELLSWGVEARYWFGRNRTLADRLQGHSLGLYGYVGYYDFERNYHGHQGEFANIGIDYTYAMAVGKRKQVHFEFSLGVGYIYSQARKYSVIEANGPLISDKITKKVSFIGPTKANISLVVPIFQRVKPKDRVRGDE